MKYMTGGDLITTRNLYMDKLISFSPTFTLHIQCNFKPELERVDEGIQRRIKVINYPFKFRINHDETDPDEKEGDLTIEDKLLERIDAFYKIIFQSAEKYFYNIETLETPPEVKDETKDYMNDNNTLKGWLESEEMAPKITGNKEHLYLCSKLYNDYIACNPKISRSEFVNSMTNTNGFKIKKTGGIRYYVGINDTEKIDYLN